MNLTKRQLKVAINTAYSTGYDDCANQAGYNIAVLQMGIDHKKHKRPRTTSKSDVLKKSLEAAANSAPKDSEGEGEGHGHG